MNRVHAFFDKATSTLTYVTWDPKTRDAVIIDPVLNYDPSTQILSTESLRALADFTRDLRVHYVLETHAHADHLSPGRDMRGGGIQLAASQRMRDVFATFAKVFAWPKDLRLAGIDRYVADGEEFSAGSLRIQALATPGHTCACTTYRIGEKLFVGDTMFMPDSGVGRCDFPGGSASTLWDSVWGRLYAFPDHFQIYVGHDYQPGGRPLRYLTTVGEQRRSNIHLNGRTSRADFVAFRESRDRSLSAPRLLNPALDWNLGAHQLVKHPLNL